MKYIIKSIMVSLITVVLVFYSNLGYARMMGVGNEATMVEYSCGESDEIPCTFNIVVWYDGGGTRNTFSDVPGPIRIIGPFISFMYKGVRVTMTGSMMISEILRSK